ncbi:MAG: phosphoribosyltransferase [Acetobacteraceae bacterium]|nr:phosphoribosyltransferase [Acetobacteraceae bacterium]
MPHFIGYDQAERMVAALMDRAAAWHPDVVVGIVRGGLVPATMAASMLARPLAMVVWDSKTGQVNWLGPKPAGRLLVVDDCCATGATMRGVLASLDQPALSLTIVHDPETSGYIPDLSHPMREFFRLPWERGEATPAARARRTLGEPADMAYEAPFVGLDLDGVFLPDIPLAEYDADLAAALERRHGLLPFLNLPAFASERAVVITGRPAGDQALTEAWLARHGHGGLHVQSRPADIGNDLASVTRYKAEAATRWGCTHYVESVAEQAIRIAALAPHLVVSWWSASDARGWIVGAA